MASFWENYEKSLDKVGMPVALYNSRAFLGDNKEEGLKKREEQAQKDEDTLGKVLKGILAGIIGEGFAGASMYNTIVGGPKSISNAIIQTREDASNGEYTLLDVIKDLATSLYKASPTGQGIEFGKKIGKGIGQG